MKKRTAIFALLLLCMLPMILNIQLVKADPGGIGKFLTVGIVGEGYVNALKVDSNQTWNFPPSTTEKVGAGTVRLTAIAFEGWRFSHWGRDLTGTSENPTYYKTEKYGNVSAVFIQETFTITPSVVGYGVIDPDSPVTVEYGANVTFGFTPDMGNHISRIVVDNITQSSFATEYTFYNVDADHTIEVVFDLEGQATVPEVLAGNTVDIFLASTALLTIGPTDGGTAYGGEEVYAFGAGAWEISIAFEINGTTATLTYDDTGLSEEDELNLLLIKAETIEILRCDVNWDLVIDGDDVSDVANAVKQPQWYNARYDPNNDGFVNEDDVHLVNENKGAILEIITDRVIDPEANTITFSLEEFSIFGAHRK